MRSCVAHYKTQSSNNCTAAEITPKIQSMKIKQERIFFIYFKRIKLLKENLIKNSLIAKKHT